MTLSVGGVLLFILGIAIAMLFLGPDSGEGGRGTGLAGSFGAEKVYEKNSGSFTTIIVVAVLLGALVAYGYYTEKKRKRNE